MEIKSTGKPKTQWRKIDKEKVYEMYMGSPYIEWTKFAESNGWNPYRSRTDFPVTLWTEEKKKIIAEQASEEIQNAVFGLKNQYHLNVIDTLIKYPKLTDDVFDILNTKIKSLKNSSEDLSKISTKEICNLAKALATITEAKHKSLMLDKTKWSAEAAETVANQLNSTPNNIEDEKWRIEVLGYEKLSSEELIHKLSEYYDKSQTK